MSYMILQRTQSSLQVLRHAEVANQILNKKVGILTDVCQQIQMEWQYKYYQDQNALQEQINNKNEYIASLQNQIENQKLKLNTKEKQVKQLKEQSVHLQNEYNKEQKSLKSEINEYIEINKNLQQINTDQKAQIYVLRYDLKQHGETIKDLQKQIKEIKPIRQCMECRLHASSRTLKRQYTPISYRYHSVTGSHEHSMEHSVVIVKKPSSDIRSNHTTVVSPYPDELPNKPNQSGHKIYYSNNSLSDAELKNITLTQLNTLNESKSSFNNFSLLCSNIHTIKRSTSVDTARSISRLHTINFKKQFVIPTSKTDICEEVQINEQSI